MADIGDSRPEEGMPSADGRLVPSELPSPEDSLGLTQSLIHGETFSGQGKSR